jgi:hypothetical protein
LNPKYSMRNSTFSGRLWRNHLPIFAMLAVLCGTWSAQAGDYVSVTDILSGKQVAHQPVIEKPRQARWRVSVGPVWRDVGDVRFKTGSYSQRLQWPNLVGRESRHLPSAAGKIGELGFREYNNGFVRTDPSSVTDGDTWNWGYQDASQVQGDQLVYSLSQGSQRTMSRSSRLSGGSWQDDSEFEAGPYIEIDRLFPLSKRLLVGPQFNFSYITIDSQNSTSTFAQHQSSELRSFLLTDRFDLDGTIPPLAPYSGSAAGPGPLINNFPSDRNIRSFRRDRQTADFFNRVDEQFDMDLFTLGAGVHAEYDFGKLFVQGSAGVSINIADWDASHRETLYVSSNGGKPKKYRSWTARENGTDVLMGVYLQTKVGLQLTERVSLSGFTRYDWNQSLTGSVGPSSFDVDLDGLSAGVMMGITF